MKDSGVKHFQHLAIDGYRFYQLTDICTVSLLQYRVGGGIINVHFILVGFLVWVYLCQHIFMHNCIESKQVFDGLNWCGETHKFMSILRIIHKNYHRPFQYSLMQKGTLQLQYLCCYMSASILFPLILTKENESERHKSYELRGKRTFSLLLCSYLIFTLNRHFPN